MTKKPCKGTMTQTLKLDDTRFALKPYLHTCQSCNKIINLSEEELGGSLVCSETYRLPEDGELRFYPGDENVIQFRYWTKMLSDSKKFGVRVAPEWRDFQNFYLWTEKCDDFEEDSELRLISKREGYFPHNCVWEN